MRKIFDILMSWGDKVYESKLESAKQMYNIEGTPKKEHATEVTVKSTKAVSRLNIAEARNS